MHDLTVPSTQWNLPTKIVFRFVFLYFALYIFPFPLDVFQFLGIDSTLIWDRPVLWFGSHTLDVHISIRPNGSGDTTWNYVHVLLFFIIAVIGMVVWSVIDHRRANYDKLYFWLTVFVRYYLAATMINYGLFKVIKTQFPFPHLGRLTGTYGDSSPMGLLWTFMGYSTSYNFFTGMAEITGGFLLFFRRTRLIGALICIGVMANVAMLNFAYDVPVKLFSSHLLLFAIFLAVPDMKRLLNFFVLNKPVETAAIRPLFKGTKWYYPYVGVKVLFILYTTVYLAIAVSGTQKQWGDAAPKPAFYGIYEVQQHIINNDTLPPLLNDTKRWRSLSVDWKDWVSVKYMDGGIIQYRFSADTINRKLSIHSQDSATHYTFTYSVKDKTYFMRGAYDSDSIFVELNRKDANDFLLVNRGFNWINEYPYNR